MELAYLNGWLGALEDARVSVNDRGYNFCFTHKIVYDLLIIMKHLINVPPI
jgi:hypothetical protein